MLGQAALAMWWDIDAEVREEFEHWHSHEHFPERLALPGFLRASRWADAEGGPGFFVLYELASYEALVSPDYLARLNAPSDWSKKMMPQHRAMVRSPCRVLESCGSTVAGHALTLRCSPAAGEQQRLQSHLRALVRTLPAQPGLVGAQLLQTDKPAIAPTTEQRLRGLADQAADWIFIATGYDAPALARLAESALSAAALQNAGAATGSVTAAYGLRGASTSAEAC
ncbi:DUF4286 family protein [Paucibacter sp. XJ19-41]|uniref:DUF4286 family protein n=1 Tax=Paucibacter sp. XJ19-41 TaxID=2927824 RepID=UPI0023493A56|nr:DUF4286 family protein [Paucibacter sp. XJ19-41]MDC6169579.1 hypothetical protein [Paucibacter sp. XJ19-41]